MKTIKWSILHTIFTKINIRFIQYTLVLHKGATILHTILYVILYVLLLLMLCFIAQQFMVFYDFVHACQYCTFVTLIF